MHGERIKIRSSYLRAIDVVIMCGNDKRAPMSVAMRSKA